MNQDEMKRAAASYAAETFITNDMFLGLGSGSTAEMFLAIVADKVKAGELSGLTCVATSERVGGLARDYGLKVLELGQVEYLDVTVDGADEVDPKTFNVVKGRGAAFLREKLVAVASKLEVIIADETKLVSSMGEKMPVPVEVIPFGWEQTAARLQKLGCTPVLRRKDGQPYQTDSLNYILDCQFPPLPDPAQTAQQIKAMVGVVEHGLFIGIAGRVVMAGPQGAYELPRQA